MTLFKYDTPDQDPFAGLDALLDHFSRGFRSTFSEAVSGRRIPVNLYETEDAYEVRAEVPGFDKEDISVEIENAVLTIQAKRAATGENGERETTLSRRITVGDDVDAEKVKAKLENGILAVHLPKSEARKPKAIQIA